jgi:signal peptidase I
MSMPSSPDEARFAGVRWIAGALCLVMLGACVLTHGAVFVSGGSMEPALYAGDLVIYRRLGATPLPGEMLVFERDGERVVHRVVTVTLSGELRTKGDANTVADRDAVAVAGVRGVPVVIVPVGRLVRSFAAREH